MFTAYTIRISIAYSHAEITFEFAYIRHMFLKSSLVKGPHCTEYIKVIGKYKYGEIFIKKHLVHKIRYKKHFFLI